KAQRVKGAWWHSAHFLVSLKARLSLVRTKRAAKVARWRRAAPPVRVSRVVKERGRGRAAGNSQILLGGNGGCQAPAPPTGAPIIIPPIFSGPIARDSPWPYRSGTHGLSPRPGSWKTPAPPVPGRGWPARRGPQGRSARRSTTGRGTRPAGH